MNILGTHIEASVLCFLEPGYDKTQGPTKDFDFDESKVEQIFDLLLREKQLRWVKTVAHYHSKIS